MPTELDRVDSPFDMRTDSLAFPNFAVGYDASLFDAEGAERMFGREVCVEGSDPCELTRPARAFVEEANLAMGGGRCEGFAVLSVLMSEGAIAPDEFGASLARSLVLDDNPALQREIAYWFTTQMIPSAVATKTTPYNARDVLPILTLALAEDATERYRIGIVRKQGQVVSGGHSLTPVGYYRDENALGVYYVRVYDNNQPDFEKLLKLDIPNNRWEFEASSNPAESSRLYFGDDSNQNPLWLAPILNRTGVHPCHFCDGATTVDSQGGAQVSLEFPDGIAGLTEDGFTAIDGVGVTPSFSASLDSEPLAMQIALSGTRAASLTDGVRAKIVGVEDAENPTASQRVRLVHGNVAVTASQLKIVDEDFLTATATGARFENNSRTGVNLLTEVAAGGKTLSVSVAVGGGSDRVDTEIDPTSGDISVDVEGASGSMVTIALESENAQGEVVQQELAFVAGATSTFAADASAWSEGAGDVAATVSTDGAPPQDLVGGCFDLIQSAGETDIDCGGDCERKCDVSQGCVIADDCASGFCDINAGRCVQSACNDGVRSGDETDVDCGGDLCDRCPAGATCDDATDCANGAACEQQVCSVTFAVGVTVRGLSVVDTLVLQNNGGDDLVVNADGTYRFASRVLGVYDVTIASVPENSRCTLLNNSGLATADVVVEVSCTEGFSIGGTLAGLEAGQSVTLSSLGEMIVLSADGAWTLAGKTLDLYQVQIVSQPATQTCTVYRGIGTATDDVTDIVVQCCASGVTGEGCTTCFPGHGAAPPQCTLPVCGDGILDPGEECDDADTDDGDGCSAECAIEAGYTCANPVQLNTGSDNAGGKLPVGGDDLIWSWSTTLDGVRNAAVVSGNCAPGQWVNSAPYAEWVNQAGCATPSLHQNTTWYQATFTILTAEAAAATSVAGTLWADNRVEDILVNGVSTGTQSIGETGFQGPGISFGAWPSSLYRAGENTITVAVRNLGDVPNAEGLLVQVPNAFGTGSVCTQ